jgi:hypothetical protein
VLDKPDFDKFSRVYIHKRLKNSIIIEKYVNLHCPANFLKCQKTFWVLKGARSLTLMGGFFHPDFTLFVVSD